MDKNLLTIARIISLITGIFWCLTIIGIPIGVLNIIASNKFSDAEKGLVGRETVRNWGIYLIFTDTISGILAIIASSSNENSAPTIDATFTSSSKAYSVEERLANLKKLYESGAISRDEYDSRRSDILNSL